MMWVYDLTSLQFALVAVGSFVAFGFVGLLVTRWVLGRKHGHVMEANDIIGFYFGAVVGFYGITLGLISVGVWQTFADADNKATMEAVSIEALFRGVSNYNEPGRAAMQKILIDYTDHVINESWPKQKKGQRPSGGTKMFTELQKHIFSQEPQTQGQIVSHQETVKAFARANEMRRLRALSSESGLPAMIWWVMIVGAAASVVLTWLFYVENFRRHLFLTGLYSGLLGLLIFLIAALDNPYRGEFSVNSTAFQVVLERMKQI
jgi:Protein of unknown function (DUF4239)